MREHVIQREEAAHEHFSRRDPASADVPHAERPVDPAPVDPAHAVDAGDARHGLFGGHALCNEGMDAASASAISRSLRPSSYPRRGTSRMLRMDNLFCDTFFLLSSRDLCEDGRVGRYRRFPNAATRHSRVEGIRRNRWTACLGINTFRYTYMLATRMRDDMIDEGHGKALEELVKSTHEL